MPAKRQSLRVAAAVAGGVARTGDTNRIEIAQRNLAAERLAAYIEQVVAAAPPLTPEQRDRLAALLRPIPATGNVA